MERMRARIFLLLIITVVFSYGCEQKDTAKKPLTETVSGIWVGTIPCADCPGIEYELKLYNDKTFREKSVYQEEAVQPFIDKGKWEIDEDSIISLNKKADGKRYFKYTGESLKMLDIEKQPIESGLAKHYILKKAIK